MQTHNQTWFSTTPNPLSSWINQRRHLQIIYTNILLCIFIAQLVQIRHRFVRHRHWFANAMWDEPTWPKWAITWPRWPEVLGPTAGPAAAAAPCLPSIHCSPGAGGTAGPPARSSSSCPSHRGWQSQTPPGHDPSTGPTANKSTVHQLLWLQAKALFINWSDWKQEHGSSTIPTASKSIVHQLLWVQARAWFINYFDCKQKHCSSTALSASNSMVHQLFWLQAKALFIDCSECKQEHWIALFINCFIYTHTYGSSTAQPANMSTVHQLLWLQTRAWLIHCSDCK